MTVTLLPTLVEDYWLLFLEKRKRKKNLLNDVLATLSVSRLYQATCRGFTSGLHGSDLVKISRL